MTLSMSAEVFAIVAKLIEDNIGLHYGPADCELLASKLSVRAMELELESLLDYYYLLRYDPRGAEELDQLVDTLVVNETYFHRELDQLEAFADRLLPDLLAARAPAPVRIWSAACATGEEPLTLAMLLRDRRLLDRVRILATDISRRALDRAARGIYGGRSLRAFPDAAREKYTRPAPERCVEIDPELRAAVELRRVNLTDAAAVEALGRFDVILVRNVLIYFDDERVRAVAGSLARALAPGGFLLMGASESLLRFGTALVCEEHGGAFFYRKAAP